MIRVTCASCNREHEFIGALAGMRVHCKGCDAWLDLPARGGQVTTAAALPTLPRPAPTPPPPPAPVLRPPQPVKHITPTPPPSPQPASAPTLTETRIETYCP